MLTTEEKAYAKINIGLDVLGRRENGYHELKMVMQTIGLCDDVLLAWTDREETVGGTSPEEKTEIRILCDTPGVPLDRRNLAYRAAEALFRYCENRNNAVPSGKGSFSGRLDIRLVKRIPAAAGLAGGSSDAAAVLRGVNRLLELGLKEEDLQCIALPLGADIPYCVSGGTALAEGIGEVLTPLPALPDCGIVLVKPPFDCSTAEIYGDLHVDRLEPAAHPDMDQVIGAIRRGSLQDAARHMGNILEIPAVRMHPEIREIKQLLLEAGATGASMSGSGSAVFGVFEEPGEAEKAGRMLRERGTAGQIFLTAPAARKEKRGVAT
ncbi:MAG: 4-(cytidine 5'-diphospho)-2-C-methyl-D-erythritol kinase [Stomatobaculum sp.]|nr:4-(cytidine 5'-diphospho)-2-C-methyl-D-erythritol kinase [Stomatobaculum sp.]